MKVLSIERERHYKHYDIRDEIWDSEVEGQPPQLMTKRAYNKKGDYIGGSVRAHRLVKKFGIESFEKRTPGSNVCTIGYSPSQEKWFGWSHRAIHGFGVGSTCKMGDSHYTPLAWVEIRRDCDLKSGSICRAQDAGPEPAVDPGKPIDTGQLVEIPSQGENAGPCCEQNCIYETGRGEWLAEDMGQALEMAMDFAESVS